ncbi:hypothetical protein [Comamonas sp.]|uniref:hypothetical protein n=1 Tax=Comamonas sp. TaxID=34028 RepID=UPI003D120333
MKHPKLNALALGTALALACTGHALAESQYGFAATGSGTVTATAKVNLSVVIPKLILLKVGTTNATQDTVSWAASLTIPGTPATTPTATANNVQVPWDGTAPTVTTTASGNVLNVAAWTNAGSATINCAMGTWSATGGPANTSFTVTSGGTTPLPHPGANLGSCASTTISTNTLMSGTWTYALTGSASSWTAGTYTNAVTYTATGV